MKALILGVRGQTGSYLAEQLADAGHDVYGMIRLGKPVDPRIRVVAGDMLSPTSLRAVLRQVRPDHIYNLAAVTAPGGAWGQPQPPGLADTTGVAVVHLLEAARTVVPEARIVHASSSAIFDPHRYGPYGAAKRFAHDCAVGYREGWGMHVSNAVLWSHSSPRQDPRFLARRICAAAVDVAVGGVDRLVLSNGDNARDWGYAGDYAAAIAAVGMAPAGDYQVATGTIHTVWDLAVSAIRAAGLGDDLVGDDRTGAVELAETPAADTGLWQVPGWKPTMSFDDWVRLIVHADMDAR